MGLVTVTHAHKIDLLKKIHGFSRLDYCRAQIPAEERTDYGGLSRGEANGEEARKKGLYGKRRGSCTQLKSARKNIWAERRVPRCAVVVYVDLWIGAVPLAGRVECGVRFPAYVHVHTYIVG